MTKQELIKQLKKIAVGFDGNFNQINKDTVLLTIGLGKRTYHFKILFDKRSATLIGTIDGMVYPYSPPNLDELLDVIKFWLELDQLDLDQLDNSNL